MNGLPWRRVLRRTLLLLSIWFVGGPLLGILVVDRLNAVHVGELPLGFWIAQQGSIYLFVILIFVNAVLADRESRDAASANTKPGDSPLQHTPGG